VPDNQFDTVVDYLTKNFPEKPHPQAQIIPGPVDVTIKEWMVPTPGSRPHDPMFAPDGTVWYSGQMANVLGHFDPKTEQFKEYKLPPKSGPHGLTPDKEGNIWYTANFAAYVGKLDPKTGEVTKYPMPDPKGRDPHTPLFAPNGNLYLTLQGANMVARVNPKTGEVKMNTSPTPKSNPYGMVMTSKGIPYFVEFGAPKIAWIDPDTLDIHEINLPHEESRPRRVAITPDDIIYYSDYSRGYLGRYDIKTGKMTEWPSPGGPKSQPYGITIVNGIVWYSESNTKPNTIVRFDPKTEKFQTWAIPSGGGVVRNMVHTPQGNLWIACSGMNRIGEVIVKKGTRVSQKN
jgi:virginiamycin B lyase